MIKTMEKNEVKKGLRYLELRRELDILNRVLRESLDQKITFE